MRTVSGPALVVAAVLTSPALWAAATGAMPLDVALVRYLLAVGVCGVLLSAAAGWIGTSPGAQPSVSTAPASEPATGSAPGSGSPTGSTTAPGAEGSAPLVGSGPA